MLPIEIKIGGLDPLKRALAAVPVEIERRLLRQALLAAGSVVLAEARRRAPRGTAPTIRTRTTKRGKVVVADYGRLRQNLRRFAASRTQMARMGKSGGITVIVSPGRAFWGWLLEAGTKTRVNKKGRNRGRIGGIPWFAPAWLAARESALARIVDGLRGRVEKLAADIARREGAVR